MVRVFLEGIIWGLIISISFGPAFFTIIQTGIDRGFKPAIYIALGILVCDCFLILLCFLGLSSIYESQQNKLYIGFIGGIILIIYGTYTFMKKPDILKRRSPKYKTPEKIQKHIKYMAKGFFLNIANPFIVFTWLTAMLWVKAQAEPGKLLNYSVIFFSGTLMTIFGIDVLKSFVGNKIKKYLRPRIQLRIQHVTGILLVVCGIILMVRVIKDF